MTAGNINIDRWQLMRDALSLIEIFNIMISITETTCVELQD